MGQVVTELVVDADTSGADQFTNAMGQAATAAQAGTQSAKDTALAIAGVSAGMIATIATVSGFVDYIVKANGQLAEMAKIANQVGLTLADFQGVQFGGQIAGLNTDQINAGLEKSAQLLNDASRNSNSLSKELDANGISVKNSNGQLISENQLLGIAADLIKRANNPGDQIAIAQMLGFTKEWIPLLEQGSGAMTGLAGEAQKAGAVIDQSVIDKATDFDAEWRKSSVTFSTNIKAALADVLPYVDDLLERSAQFAKNIAQVPKQAANNSWAPRPADITDPWEALHAILLQDYKDVQSLSEAMSKLNAFKLDPMADAFNSGAYGKSGPTSIEQVIKQANDNADAFPGTKANPLAGLTAADYDNGAPSKVVSKDVANDAVDTAINVLNKHIETQKADSDAVGQGAAALAVLQAQAAETAAVLKNGGKETDEQSDKFQDLADKAGEVADAFAKAKVSSSIQFAGGTAFLSANDVQIATQLKSIYGNDIPAALNSSYAAAMHVNDAMKEVGQALDTNITSGLTDIVTGTVSVSQGFANMGTAIVKALDQAIIKLVIVQPLMQALQGGLSSLGLGNVLGSGGAGSGSVPVMSSGLGAGTGGVSFPMFASGTPSAPGGWSVVGENGPEYMNVPAGAQILPNGVMPGNDNGSGSTIVNVSVDNSSGADVSVGQKKNSSGGVDLQIMVRKAVNSDIANGYMDKTMGARFGVKAAGQSR